MIAYSRPFFPLFLHVLGAMTLVGAHARGDRADGRRLAAAGGGGAAAGCVPHAPDRRDPGMGRDAGRGTVDLLEGVRLAAIKDPTWIGIGFAVADTGLLVLLVTSGVAFWWNRTGTTLAGRLVGGLSGLYLALLALAWLAMSGKWS